MVRTRSEGSAVLYEIRETIGLRSAGPADEWTIRGEAGPRASAPHPDDVRRGGYPAGWLGRRMRQLVVALTVVSGGVAPTHQILAGALALSGGPWGAAAALLAWPVPLLQPVLAGVGALILCAVGVMTGGWRHIGPRQGWLLLAGATAAILGAGPMVLVCALTAVVYVLAVVIGFVILFYLLRLLLR
jgi:hypothetical protein